MKSNSETFDFDFGDVFYGAPDMVKVTGGTFKMGDASYNLTIHTVSISSFEISKYEVTQKLYEDIMGTNPSYFKGGNRPVENVS